ncbi:MAG: L,D-transpeptidase family protein [bacterium]|nr:L,D-transpeptidase family protein [bacterium]
MLKLLKCLFFNILFINYVWATVLVIPDNGTIVGQIQYTHSEIGETIDEVGRRFNVGYYEMTIANTHVDAVHTLVANTPLIIPSQFILPSGDKKGIVINLAEYRLYYFIPNENLVVTFPIGIGKQGWNTPLGQTKVTAKVINPTWHPSPDVLAAAEKMGAPIPTVFPPGKNNPLGKHVLRLGWPSYLIHGTNRMDGIGARVSAGCIRMLPDDIEYLYGLVAVGTSVRIVNDPVKVGKMEGKFFVQIHPLLAEHKKDKLNVLLKDKLNMLHLNVSFNKTIINQELTSPSGLVKKI